MEKIELEINIKPDAAPERYSAVMPDAVGRMVNPRSQATTGIHPFMWFVLVAALLLPCGDRATRLGGPLGSALRQLPLWPLWFVHDKVCMHSAPLLAAAVALVLSVGARVTGLPIGTRDLAVASLVAVCLAIVFL